MTAKMPPTKGPIQKIQWLAHLLVTTAAAKERAGLTDVPSIGEPIIWQIKIAVPTTRGAKSASRCLSTMINKTVKQREHVRRASAKKTWPWLNPGFTELTP